jgi:uncharacterized protein YqeY
MKMGMKQAVENSLKEAMKANDEPRKRTYRLLLSSVKLAEVETGKQLEDNAFNAIIQKEIKMRRESIDGAQQAKREDLITQIEEEIAILEALLPKQLTDAELTELARVAILESGAENPSDMGKVMKVLMPKVQGRAPGDRVSQIVRSLLLT